MLEFAGQVLFPIGKCVFYWLVMDFYRTRGIHALGRGNVLV